MRRPSTSSDSCTYTGLASRKTAPPRSAGTPGQPNRGMAKPERRWRNSTVPRLNSWHVLGIDTGVHLDHRGYGRLTVARIDGREIETWSLER